MKKIFLFLVLIIPFNAFAINLYSPKYVIYDNKEDKILLENGIDANVSIASLTKIMTAMVIIDNVGDLNKKITITRNMLKQVSSSAYTINLKSGEVYTYRDLLYAILLPSAADAAICLSISYSGSVSKFVNEMNKKAKELGMNSTFFTNPIGMDNNANKSTIRDVLTLLKYALNNTTFRKIYTTKEYTMNNNKKIYTSLKMYNEDLHLNLDTSRIIGSKTGYTKKAGFALSQIFESNNHELISITLGAKHNNQSYHLRDGITIINYMDNNYNNQILLEKNTLLKQMEVKDSTITEYAIYSNKEIIKYLPNDYNRENFKIEYHLPEYLDYRMDKHIGSIKYYYNDELLDMEEVYLREEIKPNFISIVKDNIIYIIVGLFSIITIIIIVIILCKQRKRKLKLSS